MGLMTWAGASVLLGVLAWDAFRRWLVVVRERTAALARYEQAVERLAKQFADFQDKRNAEALSSRR